MVRVVQTRAILEFNHTRVEFGLSLPEIEQHYLKLRKRESVITWHHTIIPRHPAMMACREDNDVSERNENSSEVFHPAHKEVTKKKIILFGKMDCKKR